MLWLPRTTIKSFTNPQGTESPFKNGDPDKLLLEVSRALETDSSDVRDIRSIPDIYSKAHLFDMALRQGASNSVDSFFMRYSSWIEYEWRAMLTVIVLAENLGVTIKTVPFYPVAANNPTPAKFNDQGQDASSNDVLSPLEKIIYRSRPPFEAWTKDFPDTLTEDEKLAWNWANGLIFQVQVQSPNEIRWLPIAITSPTTLIVPAADGWNILWKNYSEIFPWVEPFVSEKVKSSASKTKSSASNQPINIGKLLDKLSKENLINILNANYKKHLPILYSWLELYRLKLVEKAKDPNWRRSDLDLEYLCGPLDGNGTNGIIKEFENELGQTSIDPSVEKEFKFVNLASIQAHYIPDNYSEIEMAFVNDTYTDTSKRLLFIDCDADKIYGHPVDKVIAIDRESVKTIRDQHKLENDSDGKWKSPILKRIYDNIDNIEFVFSDDLLLPQAVYASYSFDGNQEICADAIAPELGTWSTNYNYNGTNSSKYTYWIPMPLTSYNGTINRYKKSANHNEPGIIIIMRRVQKWQKEGSHLSSRQSWF